MTTMRTTTKQPLGLATHYKGRTVVVSNVGVVVGGVVVVAVVVAVVDVVEEN